MKVITLICHKYSESLGILGCCCVDKRTPEAESECFSHNSLMDVFFPSKDQMKRGLVLLHEEVSTAFQEADMHFRFLFSKLGWREQISGKVFFCPQISFSCSANLWTKHSKVCEFPEATC